MAKYLHWELPPSEPNVTFHDEYMSRSKIRTLRHLLVSTFTLAPELGLVWLVVRHAVHEGHHMEVRGVLVHPELLQPAVTHILVQDLHLLHPGHARQVLLRGEGGSVLELQTMVRKDFIITEEALTPPRTDRNCVSNKEREGPHSRAGCVISLVARLEFKGVSYHASYERNHTSSSAVS